MCASLVLVLQVVWDSALLSTDTWTWACLCCPPLSHSYQDPVFTASGYTRHPPFLLLAPLGLQILASSPSIAIPHCSHPSNGLQFPAQSLVWLPPLFSTSWFPLALVLTYLGVVTQPLKLYPPSSLLWRHSYLVSLFDFDPASMAMAEPMGLLTSLDTELSACSAWLPNVDSLDFVNNLAKNGPTNTRHRTYSSNLTSVYMHLSQPPGITYSWNMKTDFVKF